MKNDYKPIKPMKEVPDQLRKLRRQFLRYQQAEIVYSLSHKKLFELASDAGAIYPFDSILNRLVHGLASSFNRQTNVNLDNSYPSAVSSSRKPTSVNCTKAGSTSISVIPTPVR